MYTTPMSPDPMPWVTSRLMAEGMTASPIRQETRGVTLDYESNANLGHLLRQCTSIVSAFNTDERTFSVRLAANTSSAYADPTRREVVIGLKPLLDPALTVGQRVALAIAMAYHEVGHIIYSTDKSHAAIPLDHRVYNIAQDVHLEAMQAERVPGFAPSLDVKEWYFGESNTRLDLTTRQGRENALIGVSLYRAGVLAPTTPLALDWHERAVAWADECALPVSGSNRRMRDLVRRGVLLIGEDVPNESDEGESGEGKPDEGEPDEGGTDGSEPEAGENDGDTGSDEGSKPDATEQGGGESSPEGTGGEGEPDEGESDPGKGGSDGDTGPLGDVPTEPGSFDKRANDLHANDGRYDAEVERLAGNAQRAIDVLSRAEHIGRDRVLIGGYHRAGSLFAKREVRVTRLASR